VAEACLESARTGRTVDIPPVRIPAGVIARAPG
jgi:hypothetical protein